MSHVYFNIKYDSWDVLYLGKAYPFTYKSDAEKRAKAEEIVGYFGRPIDWEDYKELRTIG